MEELAPTSGSINEIGEVAELRRSIYEAEIKTEEIFTQIKELLKAMVKA